MTSDSDRIRELEEKLRVLSLENDELTDRAEENLLMGRFSHRVMSRVAPDQLLVEALEHIALVKDLPLTVCFDLDDGACRVRAAFSASHLEFPTGVEVRLHGGLIDRLAEGCVLLGAEDRALVEFPGEMAAQFPCEAALLVRQTVRPDMDLLFLFCTEGRTRRLEVIRPLLERVVDSLVIRLDNLLLVDQLKELNRELDAKVADRTRELEQANRSLRTEVAERLKVERELRDSHERLAQAQKMEAVGRLAGGIAHDFNNILTAIIGHVDLATLEAGPDDPLRAEIVAIGESAARAADLTRQLLAFSRKDVMDVHVLDLNGLIRNVTRMLGRLIGENIELVLELDGGIGGVLGDSSRIEQVLVNLVVNARDAMPDGGRLKIATTNAAREPEFPAADPDEGRYTGSFVRLAVSDTGDGIAPEIRQNIFEPFFTTKDANKGTGLGLATVYGIVRQHRGFIRAGDVEPGGTVFEIFLPEVESAPDSGPARRDERPTGDELILLVEDDATIRALLVRMLDKLGYRILVAGNAEAALAVARDHEGSIDLVLTDVVMPGMKGPALARELVSSRPGLKIAYMSGYTDDLIGQKDLLAEDATFLQKPLSLATLAEKIRAALDR